MDDSLTPEESALLLELAREALRIGVDGEMLPDLDLAELPPKFVEHGASFVTLTKNQELRGCIGSLEARQPLVEDVRAHAVAAALDDYRFPPVQSIEVPQIKIEISRLTTPKRIHYRNLEELSNIIQPGIDGVVMRRGIQRATFLPQVWEKVPELELFLSMLCRKMGVSADCWKLENLEIFTYQVEKYSE